MIHEFYQSSEPGTHIGLFKSVIGLLIVLFAFFVGVEIRIENDDDKK